MSDVILRHHEDVGGRRHCRLAESPEAQSSGTFWCCSLALQTPASSDHHLLPSRSRPPEREASPAFVGSLRTLTGCSPALLRRGAKQWQQGGDSPRPLSSNEQNCILNPSLADSSVHTGSAEPLARFGANFFFQLRRPLPPIPAALLCSCFQNMPHHVLLS